MQISPTQNYAFSPLTAEANSDSTQSADAIEAGSDFETFLKMLTAQIQNQDPLNPIDSADYAVQLATFSSVEQQVKTNDLLASLTTQLGTGSLSQMAGWVGMDARSAAPVNFDGAPVTLYPKVDGSADSAFLSVKDASGTEIAREKIKVTGASFDWAGVDRQGNPFSSGQFSFDIESYKNGDLVGTAPAENYANISEAKFVDGELIVVLPGGIEIPAADVKSLRGSTTA